MKKKNSNFKSAFTLIELIIVIAILGVLSAIALPRFSGFTQKAKTKTIISNIDNIEEACALYNATEGGWPKLGDYDGPKDGEFYNSSGEIEALDEDGNYYIIDFVTLKPFIDTPENSDNYILRNPIGKVYYKKDTGEVNYPGFVIENGVLKEYTGDGTEITIPEVVMSIADNAFKNKGLKSVVITGNVKTIGNEAFLGIPWEGDPLGNKLTSVTISEGVEKIDKLAFANNKLKFVKIPGTVISIGEKAFRGNDLKSVEISEGVQIIRKEAFRNNELESIIIPNSVTIIEQFAFTNNPLESINIPGNLFIHNNSFGNAESALNFKTIYDLEKKAGTYIYNDGEWTFTE